MADQAQKRSEAIERFLAEPEAMQHTPGSAFRAGYDAALADNAERVRELQFDVEQIEKARREELDDLGQKLTLANARIAKLIEQNIAIDEARDAQVTFNMQTVQRADAAESALAEARSIADRPLGTHIDYEPMDMIRDLQKALGTRVHDREPCRCGNVKGLDEARATIERVRKVLVRYAGNTGIQRGDIEDALDPQNIPEMPL